MGKYVEEQTQSERRSGQLDRQKKKESRENPNKQSREKTMRSPDKVSRENVKKGSKDKPNKGSQEMKLPDKMSQEKKGSKQNVNRESREKTMRSPDKITRISAEKATPQGEEKSVKTMENSRRSRSRKTKTKTTQQSKEQTKKSKEQTKVSEITKTKKSDQNSKQSDTKSLKGPPRPRTVQKASGEKAGTEEAPHQSKKRPPPLEFEEMQLVCKNSNPVKYSTQHYQQQLEKMIENNNKNSLLSVSDHVIRFRQTSFMESCFHLDIYNPTQKHVLFRVERPKVPYLSVKPKIGFLAPGDSRTVYLLFSFRCPRLPDDLAFSYIIYQIPIKSSDLPPLERDKKNYTTKKTRKLAKGATFEHRWTVGVAFYSGEGEADICPGPHLEGNPPQLDNKGKIFQDDYNPDEHDDNSENLPSACD